MGTRSLTHVKEDGTTVLTLYRQFDGYPSGHGAELKEFLSGMVVVNGFGTGTPQKAANGMGCLAAQLVAHFKKEIGGVYIYPPNTSDVDEEFIYTVYVENGVLCLKIEDYDNTSLYVGPVSEFEPDNLNAL